MSLRAENVCRTPVCSWQHVQQNLEPALVCQSKLACLGAPLPTPDSVCDNLDYPSCLWFTKTISDRDMEHPISTANSNLCLFYKHAQLSLNGRCNNECRIRSNCSQRIVFTFSNTLNANRRHLNRMPAFKTLTISVYCLVNFWNVESETPPPAKCRPGERLPLPHSSIVLMISTSFYRALKVRNTNKLAPCGTDGQFFATDVCAKLKVT